MRIIESNTSGIKNSQYYSHSISWHIVYVIVIILIIIIYTIIISEKNSSCSTTATRKLHGSGARKLATPSLTEGVRLTTIHSLGGVDPWVLRGVWVWKLSKTWQSGRNSAQVDSLASRSVVTLVRGAEADTAYSPSGRGCTFTATNKICIFIIRKLIILPNYKIISNSMAYTVY